VNMKPLLKLKNHATKELNCDRLYSSKVESEVWPAHPVLWIVTACILYGVTNVS
jgi:hypothetical protein